VTVTNANDFRRRMAFVADEIKKRNLSGLEETQRGYRAIALRALERHKQLTPRSEPRPDREDNPRHLADGWRLVETGQIGTPGYSVAVVNIHDAPLTNKDGGVYRKANGNFFTILDAVDVGTSPHPIRYEEGSGAFYFWWAGAPRGPRYFKGTRGATVVNHPGIVRSHATGVLRIPRAEAAREARNLRRRVQRRKGNT
jgi:hypothetical protein